MMFSTSLGTRHFTPAAWMGARAGGAEKARGGKISGWMWNTNESILPWELVEWASSREAFFLQHCRQPPSKIPSLKFERQAGAGAGVRPPAPRLQEQRWRTAMASVRFRPHGRAKLGPKQRTRLPQRCSLTHLLLLSVSHGWRWRSALTMLETLALT